ncbi:NLRC3 [Symbiodinium natans]|uniref:NLRC3 protein n=1 Tax=Symbiodinium natans TaxID=878477 RepID=A0A812UXP1_9DINO|nr:NLRC3 [Symbiodinium natans]
MSSLCSEVAPPGVPEEVGPAEACRVALRNPEAGSHSDSESEMETHSEKRGFLGSLLQACKHAARLRTQVQHFEKALRAERSTAIAAYAQKLTASDAAASDRKAAKVDGAVEASLQQLCQARLRARREAAALAQVPQGIQLQVFLDLVEENKEWLELPTGRGKGRKNMYDVCAELVIVHTTCEEKVLVLSEEAARKLSVALEKQSEERLFEEGSLQFRKNTVLEGIEVGAFTIEGVLCEGGSMRKDYWADTDRQRRWRTAAEHGRTAQECLEEVQDVQELPEALCGGQLGEESARRNKGLLKKAGTAIVLRKGVAYAELYDPGEFAPLNAFVSHYWGEATLEFKASLLLHAQKVFPSDPGKMVYYICTFCNNQHCVDLGTDWRQSPFNRALEWVASCYEECQEPMYGAVMMFDKDCSTLTRIWCIFEIFRCSTLGIQLDLYTCDGQLCRSSHEALLTQLMREILQKVQDIDIRYCDASEQSDKVMIEAAIAEHPGGWTAVFGTIQLQVVDLLSFAAILAVTRDKLTGRRIDPEDLELRDMRTGEVKLSTQVIKDCIQGEGPSRILLTGPGGSGKTVFSMEVVRLAAELAGANSASILPVRVPLAELAQYAEEGHAGYQDPSPDLLQRWAKRAFGPDSRELDRGDRRLVLVLDGFDEAGKARRRILDWLQTWLRENLHRCACVVLTSRPSGTSQVLDASGEAREPVPSPVLGKLSERYLLTQDVFPPGCHVQLSDGPGSPAINKVVTSEEGFLLRVEGLDLGPGTHEVPVRRKDPRTIFSATVLIKQDDAPRALLLLDQALLDAGGDPAKKKKLVVVDGTGRRCQDERGKSEGVGIDKWVWPVRIFYVQSSGVGELGRAEVTLQQADGAVFLTGGVGVGDVVRLGSQEICLDPTERCCGVFLEQAVEQQPARMVELSLQAEVSAWLQFLPLELLALRPAAAARISKFSEAELDTLPEAVWRTPLMANILGKFREEREYQDLGATAELTLMRYSVDKLLQQAEVRAGTTGLRSLMGPLCLRKLQNGQRLLAEADFPVEVVFQEALRGHLNFFEPVAGRSAVQIYHLRMHEFLAAEAWQASKEEVDLKSAFREASQQPMLRGALRFRLMLATEHATSLDLDLDDRLAPADAESFEGLLGGLETLRLRLPDSGGLGIGDAGAKGLASALGRLAGLRELVLGLANNGIGREGAQALAGGLRQLSELRKMDLDLRGNPLGDEGARAVGEGLSQCSKLEEVTLDLQLTGNGPEGARALAGGLRQLSELRKMVLGLDSNQLGDEGARAVGEGLSQCSKLEEVTLHLYAVGLGPEGARALTGGLRQLSELRKMDLLLSGKQLGDEGARALGEGLSQCSKLEEVTLYLQSTGLGPEGARALTGGLRQLSELRKMDLLLSGKQLGDEGARALGEGLSQCSKLEEVTLHLSEVDLGPEGAQALAGGLRQLSELRKMVLDLASNQLGDEGARALGEGLSQCSKLEEVKLDLQVTGFGPEGARALAGGLRQLSELRNMVLALASNQLGDEGARAVGEGLSQCSKLEEVTLRLSEVGLGPEGARALAGGLRQLSELRKMDLGLSGNQLGDEGARAVGEGLSQCSSKLEEVTLGLRSTGFGPEGAQALAGGLRQLSELRNMVLRLNGNQFGGEETEQEIRALLEALPAPEKWSKRLVRQGIRLSKNCLESHVLSTYGGNSTWGARGGWKRGPRGASGASAVLDPEACHAGGGDVAMRYAMLLCAIPKPDRAALGLLQDLRIGHSDSESEMETGSEKRGFLGSLLQACKGAARLRTQVQHFEKALRAERSAAIASYAQKLAASDAAASDRKAAKVDGAVEASLQQLCQARLRSRREAAALAQVPRGIQLQVFLDLVEENKEWLELPTGRGKGRKNMYDVCAELVIVHTTCEEKVLVLSEEAARKLSVALEKQSEERLFEEGSLQFRNNTVLEGIEVGGFTIEGILCEGGSLRNDYWADTGRQRRWRTAAEHGRTAQDVQDVQGLPETLRGGQLGEESARRKKGLLKKAGTAIVLRKGVAYADLYDPGEFAPLNAFVSHYWGEATLEFKASLLLHAQKVCPSDPGKMVYYICTFCNNQHCVDLGTDWRQSPFNRALEWVASCYEECQEPMYGAVMMFDKDCSTLTRIWCIFEIFRCSTLGIQLDLYTSDGQLCRSSHEAQLTQLMREILQKVQDIDIRYCDASEQSDKVMIEAAIAEHPGGWTAVFGTIQLQVVDLLSFAAILAVTRDRLTGRRIHPEDLELRDALTGEVKPSTQVIKDCIQGEGPSRILLTGPGGSGKTVFSMEVVRLAAELAGADSASILPVRVPLAELAQYAEEGHAAYQDPSPDLLQRWAQRAFGPDCREIDRGDRRLVLVLDGFDEAGKARRRILDWLQTWLRENLHRCACVVLTSRPSGTSQVVDASGEAREPAPSPVLGKLSERYLLTQDVFPAGCHVQLSDGLGSPAINKVVASEEGFLLQVEGLDLGPGTHEVQVRRKDPRTIFSATVLLERGDLLRAGVLLQQALLDAGGDPAEEDEEDELDAVLVDGTGRRCQNLGTDGMDQWVWPLRAFLVQPGGDGELGRAEVTVQQADGAVFLTGGVGVGDVVQLGSQEIRLDPTERCCGVLLEQAVEQQPARMVELSLQAELSAWLQFLPLELLALRPAAAARISQFSEAELGTLPEAVWRTPLMANILGKFREEREDQDLGAAAELTLMRYSVDKLLQQAEVRTGTTGLRSLMGPLCLRQLQDGQRLLAEDDFPVKVVFQEALRGHLNFFEPVAGRSAVQIYHLRMHEFLAAEASEQEVDLRSAFREASQQPMLRGALRFRLMLATERATSFDLDLSESGTLLAAVDAESFEGLLGGLETLRLRLPDSGGLGIGDAGAKSLAAALGRLAGLRELDLGLGRNCIGPEGARALASGLRQLLELRKMVLDLTLSPFGPQEILLRDEGARALAEGLSQCSKLEEVALHLSNTGLGDEGVRALAEGLSQCSKIEEVKLDLESTGFGPEGARALAGGLRQLSELRKVDLNLQGNKICDEGARALGEGLSQCSKLEEVKLDLFGNGLGPEGARALEGGLRQLSELRKVNLNLQGNEICGEEAKEEIRAFWEALPAPEKETLLGS